MERLLFIYALGVTDLFSSVKLTGGSRCFSTCLESVDHVGVTIFSCLVHHVNICNLNVEVNKVIRVHSEWHTDVRNQFHDTKPSGNHDQNHTCIIMSQQIEGLVTGQTLKPHLLWSFTQRLHCFSTEGLDVISDVPTSKQIKTWFVNDECVFSFWSTPLYSKVCCFLSCSSSWLFEVHCVECCMCRVWQYKAARKLDFKRRDLWAWCVSLKVLWKPILVLYSADTIFKFGN